MIGAVDIGGTKIAVGLVTDNGHLLDSTSWKTNPAVPFYDEAARIKRKLTTLLEVQGEELTGTGMAVTGQWNPHTGVLAENSFLPNWSGKQLQEVFSETFGVSTSVDNDAVAAAVGEYLWGAGKGTQHFIYVTVSTGIGVGVILNGQVLRGAGGTHGESGHQVIDADAKTPPCFCGARGCWESLASGTAMTRRWKEKYPEKSWSAKEICAAARAGNSAAREMVMIEGRYLGVGLANLITHFIPEVIALGGGVMESFDLFQSTIEEQIREQCVLVTWQNTKVAQAHYGKNSALVGAAGLWKTKH